MKPIEDHHKLTVWLDKTSCTTANLANTLGVCLTTVRGWIARGNGSKRRLPSLVLALVQETAAKVSAWAWDRWKRAALPVGGSMILVIWPEMQRSSISQLVNTSGLSDTTLRMVRMLLPLSRLMTCRSRTTDFACAAAQQETQSEKSGQCPD